MSVSDLLFNDYSVLDKILSKTDIPQMFQVSQSFTRGKVENVFQETMQQLNLANGASSLREGMAICITASSRGIDRQREILKAIVEFVKQQRCSPFIIPAMGSHGGATADGQLALLAEYGITEDYLGCPIRASMETVCLGFVKDEERILEVHIDRYAAEADGILVFGRIKPHSAFRGPYESGLMKMMCVGMGKQRGAESLHSDGFGTFKRRISLCGEYVRLHSKVLFGISTVENGYNECHRIDVIPSEDIPMKEIELLGYAKSIAPSILVPEGDVLVVQQIGKNYSGSGMDPNVTGTWATPYGGGGLQKQRVTVLDLSDASHGNALGMGNADIVTRRFFDKIDFMEMYPNVLTNTVFKPIKMPMVLKDDRMAIQGAIKTCNDIDQENPRIVLIRNSMDLSEIYLSKAYWNDVDHIKGITKASSLFDLRFDGSGNLIL